jgi:hypothetical protein
MSEAPAQRARQWAALAVALLVLNAALTFRNVWPTPWIAPRAELSLELGVLLLALVAWTAFVRPLGSKTLAALTVLVLVFVGGRYAEVTAPALYGRPVNLYWDSQHIPNVAAMLAEVGPWWLSGLLFAGIAALVVALFVAIAWCLRSVARVLREPLGRGVVGAIAGAVVALYLAGHAFDWRVRHKYSLPVTATFLQQARFVVAAWTANPARDLPGLPLPDKSFNRLQGDDVVLMFLESYGAITYDEPSIARIVAPARDELAHAAEDAKRHIVSAYAASPTFGGGSWLAHASFMSGVEVRDPGDYMLLLTQQRTTWPKLFKAAGYRSVAVMPGMRSAWPEGAFYGFDRIYDEHALEYRGPDFGWWRIPDQFSLARIGALESRESPAPLFVFLPTINTHIPFLPVPPYQADWPRLLTPEPFPSEDVRASLAQMPNWQALGEPYADSFVYTFTYLSGYVRERAGADETLVLIGDHQPAASVAGVGARWDVPVHVITSRADVAATLVAAGFVDGVALAPQQRPLGTLSELSVLLLEAFGAP